jgi:dihydroorotate dehydrogenase electron transfer subunit
MKKVYKTTLSSKKELADGIFDYTVVCPEIAKESAAGQFLHIDCGEGTLLRRPISICDADGENVRFVFEVKGAGTRDLAAMEIGDTIDIMGPLGNSFIDGEYKKPVLIGGGIGIFPLYMLAKKLDSPKIFLGFREKSRVIMEEEFKAAGNVKIATDDGSYGYHGFAVSAAEQAIDEDGCGVIYACGPMPMLKAVKAMAEKRNIPCRLSLEQRMGCGIGACLVCSCATVFEGTDKYKRVCKDGPVFWSTEVTLDE